MVPDWLTKKEDYHPQAQRRSGLLSNEKILVNLLNKLHQEGTTTKEHRFHPVVYLINVIIVSFILCWTNNHLTVWLVGLYEAMLLLRLNGKEIIKILRRSLNIFILNLFLYCPSFFLGTGSVFFLIKIGLVFIAIMTYATTTSIYDFLTALKQLHVPNFIIFQIDIFVKHLHVLGDFLLQTLQAIEARSVGNNKVHNHMFGVIFGNLYLEMVKYGKELYNALIARAFTGNYDYMRHKLNGKDYALIGSELVFLILLMIY